MRKIFTLFLTAFVAISASAITRLPDQGVYKIQNVYSGTWVKLQTNYLADISAQTQDEASPLLVWYSERDENGEALLTNLSGDGGDMIETLEFIKGLIQEVLEYNEKPTWFLEEMFQLHLVPTGDADGSVYLCVDVPAIEDWDEIKAIILDAAGGQTAVTYYITHMVPGNRHYMGIDYDLSFGYRLQAGTPEGTDIKFLMHREALEGGYCFVKTASATSQAPYLRRVHEKTSTVDLADPHADASAVFNLGIENDIQVSSLAVQGLDLAPLASTIGDGAYLALCPTNTTDEKFVYDAYALKLQLPDENVDASAVIAAAVQALGEDSEIVDALTSQSNLIKNRAALYFVHSDQGGVTVTGDEGYLQYADDGKWKLEFLDTDANYFAPEATVAANGKYYTTLYAAFPYSIVDPSQVVAYNVTAVSEAGVPSLAEMTDEVIPAGTPVLLECVSQTAANNMLMPAAANAAGPAGAPMLASNYTTVFTGTYFDDNMSNDKNTMLTLQEGLKFDIDNSLDYMPANKAWVSKTIVTGINTVKTDNQDGDNTIYDLMGRKVTNPGRGIYIQNGKKVVF